MATPTLTISERETTQRASIAKAEMQTVSAEAEIIVCNPATGKEIGRVPVLNQDDVNAAVESGRTAQSLWAELSFNARAKFMLKAREIILAEMDAIARLISDETGKPVAEALSMEIVPALDLMHYFARNTKRLLKSEKLELGQYGLMGRESRVIYRPLGVVGIISPWNFPWSIPLGEIVMALMAGNTVVLKPSELTPLTALKIAEVFALAGLPENVFRVVTGTGETGAALVEARADKIMFTGSVATGKKVGAAAMKYLIPVVLELGGKDPMIVLEDADVEIAARGAVWGAFANSGQACASVERCYVHESIAPEFIEKVVAETKNLRQAAPDETDELELGSMASMEQREIAIKHVADARARGAKILTGGEIPAGLNADGAFYAPTVLTGVDHTMLVMREETFAPVLPVMIFSTEDEAVRLANDSAFGLTASVWTKNIGRGRQVAERINAGTVMVNEVLYTHGLGTTPWGGVKESGIGRTHGRVGLLELVAPHHIHVNRFAFLPDVWWFNYSASTVELFKELARRFTSGSLAQSTLIMPQLLKRLGAMRRAKNGAQEER